MLKITFQLAILLSIPSLTTGQNVDIKVFNKTGYDLDSVSFYHFSLGKISKDSTFFFLVLMRLRCKEMFRCTHHLELLKEKQGHSI